jgi:hypothetical protein
VFNVFPRKGLVAVGSDADVIVFDPTVTHTLSAATHHRYDVLPCGHSVDPLSLDADSRVFCMIEFD